MAEQQNPIDIRMICRMHIDSVLEDFSFKNKEDSFAAFAVVVKYVRDVDSECDECRNPAAWSIAYPVQPKEDLNEKKRGGN